MTGLVWMKNAPTHHEEGESNARHEHLFWVFHYKYTDTCMDILCVVYPTDLRNLKGGNFNSDN